MGSSLVVAESMVAGNVDLTLSIVIPAFNEAENIHKAIEVIENSLAATVNDYEIIVIDDGSCDQTGDILDKLARKNERIIVIRNEKNCGKGASLRCGFKLTRMDWVLFVDADLQIDIAEIKAFLPYTNEFDVIVGYRVGRRDPLSRRIFSKIYTYIIHFFLRVCIRDINCPFKLVRNILLKNVELHAIGFFIDAELMLNVFRRNCRLKELPVACHPRLKGTSSVRFRHVLETLKELLVTLRRNTILG